ncbi:MAG: exodeoxyribonuclease VII small subunit [Rectinema sp.]|nr:exodeoxyribonuclease VII small subunit [Rectinema sp.]
MKDFEARLSKLESLAEKMRDPDLTLEESLRMFEEGVALAKELKTDLEALQGKVEILLNSLEENDEPKTAPFDAGLTVGGIDTDAEKGNA